MTAPDGSGPSRRDQLRAIIQRATKTTRDDLSAHEILLLQHSEMPAWAKPKAVAREAERLAGQLPKVARSLREFDALALRRHPGGIDDARAVSDAAASLDRAVAALRQVQESAGALWQELATIEGLKQESHRDWRPYRIALGAAFVYHDLTGENPGWWLNNEHGVRTPYHRMVEDLCGFFRVHADLGDPIRWAMREFKKTA